MRTLVLIACSGRKLMTAAPARSLYQGQLFKSSVRCAEEADLPWAVLSAKLGLVMPDQVIQPYEQRLTGRREEQLRWASRVIPKLESLGPTAIVFLAGKNYRTPLIPWCQEKAIPWQAPLEGMTIGLQLAAIRTLHLALDSPGAGCTGSQ